MSVTIKSPVARLLPAWSKVLRASAARARFAALLAVTGLIAAAMLLIAGAGASTLAQDAVQREILPWERERDRDDDIDQRPPVRDGYDYRRAPTRPPAAAPRPLPRYYNDQADQRLRPIPPERRTYAPRRPRDAGLPPPRYTAPQPRYDAPPRRYDPPHRRARRAPPPPRYDDGPRRDDTYSMSEIRRAGHGFFGSISKGMARVIEYAFQQQGRPNGYILGEEAGGAFIAGLRYGEGQLYTKYHGSRKVFWQGPSLGYDAGASGSKTMVLVYNIRRKSEIFKRYAGIEGSAYLVGGVSITFQKRGRVILAPIRAGVGLRLGANVGYLKYTRRPTWNPF
ncbi:MAG: DUF1134 domain-containing protein [Pseudomonadota bacterium]